MTNEELDRAVAAMLGWKRAPAPYAEWRRRSATGLEVECALPFSTDIARAFEVVEWLAAKGWRVLVADWTTEKGRRWWHASARPQGDATKAYAEGEGETAPLAICRAALKVAALIAKGESK